MGTPHFATIPEKAPDNLISNKTNKVITNNGKAYTEASMIIQHQEFLDNLYN